ncbi:MAG: trypsin-like peptidase domain-containing protein [Eubacteriales bacterium]|nr:trypsin-like peptidase domain-containing protein [Eubacteriales bacterium]
MKDDKRKGLGIAAIVISVFVCTVISSCFFGMMGYRVGAEAANRPLPTPPPFVWTDDPGTFEPTKEPAGTPRPTASVPPLGEGDYEVAIGNVEDIVAKVSASVVNVYTQTLYKGKYTNYAEGSGVVISEEGHIVTNNHLVEDADRVLVTFADGEELVAEVLGRDVRADLAVLQVKGKKVEPIKMIADSSAIKAGTLAIAIGNAMGESGSVTVGVISAPVRYVYPDSASAYIQAIQTDAAINPGNSGGALVNKNGELIGIVFWKLTATSDDSGGTIPVDGMGYAIHIDLVKKVTASLIATGKVTRSGLNLRGGYARTGEAASGVDLPSGIYVQSVEKGGAADKAGITAGCVITHLNGERITGMGEFSASIQYLDVGTPIELTVVGPDNSEQVRTVTVTLEELILN